MIGTLLNGRFRLEEQIGSGGMSTVYRAFDETLERWVAIKLMHRAMSEDASQLERFRREARTVARLSHPHVVTVIDAGEDEGHPYIVLEYVEGETLKARIKRAGRLPVVEAVAYAIEIGRALMAAHAERLVHRDVKPQNVLIDAAGRAKVTDFGISRSLEDEGLTATGRVLGTTDYVSPEQALGEGVTVQSDVYSLGICLFEMLTGEVPFKADSQVGVAMKHVREPMPDVQLHRPEASAALAAVVERATAKERANRYATVEEMVRDLERALAIEAARAGNATGEATSVLQALPDETGEFAPGRLRHPARVVRLTVLVAILAALVVAFLALRTERSADPAPAPAKAAALEPVKLAPGGDFDPFSDDGEEHPEEVGMAVDDVAGTTWGTEDYSDGGGLASKPGVGLYVDAGTGVPARRLDVRTTTPGWEALVYASNRVPEELKGWGPALGRANVDGERARISLDTAGRPFRYYLVWLARLPPEHKAEIENIRLLR